MQNQTYSKVAATRCLLYERCSTIKRVLQQCNVQVPISINTKIELIKFIVQHASREELRNRFPGCLEIDEEDEAMDEETAMLVGRLVELSATRIVRTLRQQVEHLPRHIERSKVVLIRYIVRNHAREGCLNILRANELGEETEGQVSSLRS